jgi:hypothetical protein
MHCAAFSSSGPDTLTNSGADFFTDPVAVSFTAPVAVFLTDPVAMTVAPGDFPQEAAGAKRPRNPLPSDSLDSFKRSCPAKLQNDIRRTHESKLNLTMRAYLSRVLREETEEIDGVRKALESLQRESDLFFKNSAPGDCPEAHVVAKKSGTLLQKKLALERRLQGLRAFPRVSEAQEIARSYVSRCSSAPETECAAILQDFVGRYCDNVAPVHRCNIMLCPVCEIPMNIMTDDGFLLCLGCRATQVHTERTSFSGQGAGDDADVHIISNKRESNFRDFLHLLQGKKLNPALEAKMPLINRSLLGLLPSWSSLPLCSSVVQSSIVETLTSIGLRKFSKYVVLIEARLRNIPVPAIPIQVENRLCAMFLIIVDPYERHKPPSRKHFISYAYCAWQFCRIEKLPQYLPYFRLLKDEKKINQQDVVFKLVCAEVSWDFVSPVAPGSFPKF